MSLLIFMACLVLVVMALCLLAYVGCCVAIVNALTRSIK